MKYDDQERLKDAYRAGDREGMALALLDIAGSIILGKEIPPTLDADDLAQEAAIEALERLAGYRPEKGTLRTYCYGSIRFTILDRSRKERRRMARLRYLPAHV